MIDFPEPTMIKTNGIDMAVYEMGPKDGVPVVMCHGFPELAYSWRHQLPALAAAGYRAIAPDQRGYGRSARPDGIENYDMAHLTGDLVGMLDTLGIDKAIFAGHDWGGLVVWQMPLFHESRVAGIIGVNTPFLPRPPMDPIAADARGLWRGHVYRLFPEAGRGRCGADEGCGQDVSLLHAQERRDGGRICPTAGRRPPPRTRQGARQRRTRLARRAGDAGERAPGLHRHLHTHGLYRRHQLVSQFHPQLAGERAAWSRRFACPR